MKPGCRVVIVGGGFAGLHAARGLRRAPVQATLIDRRNFHLFQPLLYQVATGALSPGDIAAPLRWVLRRQKNARVLLGEMTDLDAARRRLILADGDVEYDALVIAAGAVPSYFGNDGWQEYAPGLKSIEDAVHMRSRVFHAFEAAEREPDPERRRAWLTFVVVGAGPTGVELAGALGDISRDTLRGDFRSIRPEESRILLVDLGDRVLSSYPASLSAAAERSLIALGVRPLLGVRVKAVDADSVTVAGPKGEERIATRTVLWAAGVAASPLSRVLERRVGAKLRRDGRVIVERDFTIAGHPETFVIGDMAYYEQDGAALPGTSPVAMQEGAWVARALAARCAGSEVEPFRFRHKGDMATIGRASAVAVLGPLRLDGFVAWVFWLFVHLLYLVGFQNRLLVLVQWGFQYFTFNRGARLITGEPDA
jgi:NADH dehydrogenase